ncbi:hypothetical protein CR513_34594, partial [Mucuna pruriens]
MVNEIDAASNQRLENQLTELTSLVRQLAVSQHQPAMAAKICGICTSVEHPTDMCPTLQETESDQPEHVGAVGGFQYWKQQIRLDHSTTSNMEDNHFDQAHHKDHMQLREPDLYRICLMEQLRVPTQGNSPPLEDLMKQLATSNLEFQQSVSSSNMQFQQNMTTTI